MKTLTMILGKIGRLLMSPGWAYYPMWHYPPYPPILPRSPSQPTAPNRHEPEVSR